MNSKRCINVIFDVPVSRRPKSNTVLNQTEPNETFATVTLKSMPGEIFLSIYLFIYFKQYMIFKQVHRPIEYKIRVDQIESLNLLKSSCGEEFS